MSTSKKSWYQQPDMLVALSAVLVSLVALAVGVYSAYVDRSFARASVWPSVLLAQSYSDDRFSYVLLNQGTGPAIIQYARLTQDGKTYSTWRDWLDGRGLADVPFAQSHIGGGVVRAGQTVTAFTTRDEAARNALLENRSLSIEVCFCSVFDD